MSGIEVPALAVLGPLTVTAIVAVFWRLRSRGEVTVPRLTAGVAACLCGATVLDHTLFPFTIAPDDSRPWYVWLNVVPFTDLVDDPIGIVLNVALFVPVGLLMPLVVRVRSVGSALLHGFLLSLGIEVVQLAGDLAVSTGRVADVDDLIGNSAGALIGYAAFRLALLVPPLARAVELASWHPVAATARPEVGDRGA
ncbi:VanZ family protein [Saccharopolyspora hordei]|uniref:VanZ family protein n=1 Tax=Saccharopolyspora hordei TaxID=1838 RepID=A0A853AIY3_9PSEU|nr:VanZ family protein [Saccharopolyspora hordei]NYI83968.1 VanZ family protein [Saccharopolyspora hordei]